MRLLTTLCISLLIAGSAGAQQRGMVDHIPTADLPTCSADTPELYGYRVYDTTANMEMTCSETAVTWVTSGGTSNTAYPAATHDVIQICGEATTVNNTIVFYAPDTTLVANTNGFTCDINNTGTAGADGGAEEIAEGVAVYNAKAFHVTGMTCRQEADSAAALVYRLRQDGAAGAPVATVPSVTCTIDGTGALVEQDCVADIQTTTVIPANAKLTLAVSSASDIADGNGFICNISVVY